MSYFLFGKAGSTQSARALSVVYKNGSEACVQGVGDSGHEMRDLRMLSWKLKLQRPRRLRKRHLKSDALPPPPPPCFKLHRAYCMSFNLSNVSNFFWSWVLKNFIEVQEKKKKVVALSFTSFTKREIRHFHVVVVQVTVKECTKKRDARKKSCCLANLNQLLFCRSRWRRRRRCLVSSLS